MLDVGFQVPDEEWEDKHKLALEREMLGLYVSGHPINGVAHLLAAQVDTAKYPKRAGEAGAKQFCYNCNLYNAAGEEGWGPCQIFPGKQVAAKGWCNAWVPKAG